MWHFIRCYCFKKHFSELRSGRIVSLLFSSFHEANYMLGEQGSCNSILWHFTQELRIWDPRSEQAQENRPTSFAETLLAPLNKDRMKHKFSMTIFGTGWRARSHRSWWCWLGLKGALPFEQHEDRPSSQFSLTHTERLGNNTGPIVGSLIFPYPLYYIDHIVFLESSRVICALTTTRNGFLLQMSPRAAGYLSKDQTLPPSLKDAGKPHYGGGGV